MKKGFTLIELLITTAIFSIVTGGGIASYNQFNQREKLKAAALEIKTYLRKAQTNAMAGVKDDVACSGQPLDGWCLDMWHSPQGGGKGGYLYGHCGGPEGSSNPVNFNVESYTLPEGVTISFNPANNGILLFKPLTQGVDQASTICLSTTSFGMNYQYKISVTVSGEITDSGFTSCP